jgi:hypothetical protein
MTLEKFVDYVYDFYGPGGIYPMSGLTRNAIAQTLQVYFGIIGPDDFYGDSVDRERVRDILLLKYRCPSFE